MELTSQAVDDMMKKCLFTDEESMDGAIRVDGIVNNYAFHPIRIARHAEEIGQLLAELPIQFQRGEGGGGGWTFLNACDDKHGKQWTGLHQQMERLFCLGIAAGKADWLMPRDLWPHLPGGMPYVAVN